MDENELIPNRSNSRISINMGYGNPFDAVPFRFHRMNCKKLTAIIIIVCVLFLMAGILTVTRNSGKKKKKKKK